MLAEVEGWAAAFERRWSGSAHRLPARRSAAALPGSCGGLLGGVDRKNGWQLAEHAGDEQLGLAAGRREIARDEE